MKKLLLLLIIPFLSFGQGWEYTFGGSDNERGRSVKETQDGGIIICGYTGYVGGWSEKANNDIYLIKTNNIGVEEWSQIYGGEGDERAYSVQQTIDGGYVVFGIIKAEENGDTDFYLIKVDGNGAEEWSKTYGGEGNDWGYSIEQTTDNGYIMFGYLSGGGLYLIKTDDMGNEQWSEAYGYYNGDDGEVQQTTDGGYILCGEAGKGAAIVKTDSVGNEQWMQNFNLFYSSWNIDLANSVQQTTDGGYILCGLSYWYQDLQFDSYDALLVKTDSDGNEEWSRVFGDYNFTGGCYDEAYSVRQTIDGGYIVCGMTNSFGNGGQDVYLIKTDSNGEEEWFQTYGGSGYDVGYSVEQKADGGYVICGVKTDNGNEELYLIITDIDGNVCVEFDVRPPLSNKTLFHKVDLLGKKTTNKGLQLHIYDDGSVEKKYLIK